GAPTRGSALRKTNLELQGLAACSEFLTPSTERSTGGTWLMVRRTVIEDQESLWALGWFIAGRSRVRVGRWDGRKAKWQYSTRDERDLTAEVPSAPAAVLLYNSQARCRTLVVDVDVPGAPGLEL